ncbi:MAG: amidohydrolase family protein, partial [Clostridia bacterium]|nr:amidohydrolase family protein [Clostridia bacterium]
MIDILIKNGNVYDGKNAPFVGDVAVIDGKIVQLGHVEADAAMTIDANGRCVTPGFIDIHRHADMAAFRHGFGEAELSQGLTTIINGNCGMGPAPVGEDGGLRGYLKPVLGEMLPEVDSFSTAGYMASLE